MSSRGIATPEELAILAKAVSDHCVRHRIIGPDCDEIAARVMNLFLLGKIDPIELADGLEQHLEPFRKQA